MNQNTSTMHCDDSYLVGLSVGFHDRRFWVALWDPFNRLSDNLQGCLEIFFRSRSVIFKIVSAFDHSFCRLVAHWDVMCKVSETLVLGDTLPTIHGFLEPSATYSQSGEEVETLRAKSWAEHCWCGKRHHLWRSWFQVRLQQVVQCLQLSHMTQKHCTFLSFPLFGQRPQRGRCPIE